MMQRATYNSAMRKRGNTKVVVLVVSGIVLLAVLGAFGSKFVFDKFRESVQNRRAEKDSAGKLLDAAEGMVKGQALGERPTFPDTPTGRMNSYVYDLMVGEQARQKEIEDGLKRINWDWVFTPESLRTKQNLELCLQRIDEAKKLVARYDRDLDQAWSSLMAKMEAESSNSSEAKGFLAGFRESASRPGNGLYYARQINKLLKENHAALEDAVRFLYAHEGQYTIDDAGTVTFEMSVPQADVDRYNDILGAINASMHAIEDMEDERARMAQQKLNQAREQMR